MWEVYTYVLALVVGVLVGIGIGTVAHAMRNPPTYSDQWESVYVVCSRNGGNQTDASRAECIAAADRVMKCAKEEVKP